MYVDYDLVFNRIVKNNKNIKLKLKLAEPFKMSLIGRAPVCKEASEQLIRIFIENRDLFTESL